jgi:hypothetical protein
VKTIDLGALNTPSLKGALKSPSLKLKIHIGPLNLNFYYLCLKASLYSLKINYYYLIKSDYAHYYYNYLIKSRKYKLLSS